MSRAPYIIKGRGKGSTRKEATRLLIVTDGLLTEPTYFEHINHLTKDVVKVHRDNANIGDLVEKAAFLQSRAGNKYDAVFVVCDIDARLEQQSTRNELDRAIAAAQKCNVRVILSHACIEVWLLCHVLDSIPSTVRDRTIARQLAKRYNIITGRKNKETNTTKITKQSIQRALEVAEKLRRTYGSDPTKNGPLTDVDIVMRRLRF